MLFLKAYRAWDSLAEAGDPEFEAWRQLDLEAHEDYKRRLEQLGESIQADVMAIAEPFCVDDALVTSVVFNDLIRQIELTLRCGNLQIGYFDLVLTYSSSEMTKQDRCTLERIASTTIGGFQFRSDCYCHEIDRLSDGRIEHSFLFHDNDPDGEDGLVFTIRSQRLDVRRIERPDRTIPRLEERIRTDPD